MGSTFPSFEPPAAWGGQVPAEPWGRAPAVVPADAGARFGARLIDGVLAFALMMCGGLVVTTICLVIFQGDLDSAGAWFAVPMVVVMFGVTFCYEWVQVSRSGATFGKRIVGIRVVNAADGGPVPVGRAMLRALCFSPGIYHVPNYIPVLGQLNVLWHLWDRPLRQCLHDKAAKTVVVRRQVQPRTQMSFVSRI